MSAFHLRQLKISRMIPIIICILSIMLLSSCGEAKYKFIDDGVLQAPDGTIYHRYDKGVYYCFHKVETGKFLGKVKGYHGRGVRGLKKGVYSLSSDGSDDYIRFIEEELLGYNENHESIRYKNGEYQRSLSPIYVKEGCELDFKDWDKVVYVKLRDQDLDEMTEDHYYLKEGFSASEAMNALIGEEWVEDRNAHYIRDHLYLHYRFEGIDLIEVCCLAEYRLDEGWRLMSTEGMEYRLNTDAFDMFDMSEETLELFKNPVVEFEP